MFWKINGKIIDRVIMVKWYRQRTLSEVYELFMLEKQLSHLIPAFEISDAGTWQYVILIFTSPKYSFIFFVLSFSFLVS